MLAQDSRWIGDALLSARKSSGWLPLLLVGHSARIVYEGSILVRSADPDVGVPQVAQVLADRFADVIARSRHGGKFLDDNKKSFDDLRLEMLTFVEVHRDEFLGNAVWFARWFESDIGVCLGPQNRVLTTTITTHFRTGLGDGVPISEAGSALFSVAESLGQALGSFAQLGRHRQPIESTIDYRPLGRIRDVDRRVSTYAAGRYDDAMDLATKLLILMVEGEVNTARQVISLGAQAHPDATFRARFISLYHSLRAVEEVLRLPQLTTASGTQRVRSLLAEKRVRRFLDDAGLKKVRNRCMHYEIRDRSISLDPALPMFGIVEGLSVLTFDELDGELQAVTEQLSDALQRW